jgi:hypothetical protein
LGGKTGPAQSDKHDPTFTGMSSGGFRYGPANGQKGSALGSDFFGVGTHFLPGDEGLALAGQQLAPDRQPVKWQSSGAVRQFFAGVIGQSGGTFKRSTRPVNPSSPA